MKELYPIPSSFTTENLNFQQIAKKFWETFKIRFTAVEIYYDSVKNTKKCKKQYATRILEHGSKGKDLKPENMTDEQYEKLLTQDKYWTNKEGFAWTLGPELSNICIIDLDFETHEEYEEFRKLNPDIDELLDSAFYVEKSLKLGGYHFFVHRNMLQGLEKNLKDSKVFQIFIKCHMCFGAFTLPQYQALSKEPLTSLHSFTPEFIYNIFHRDLLYNFPRDSYSYNIFYKAMEAMKAIYNNKDIYNTSRSVENRGFKQDLENQNLIASSFKDSSMLIQEKEITNYKPLAPTLQLFLDSSTDNEVSLDSYNLLVKAGIISKALENATKGKYKISYLKTLFKPKANECGGRFNYLQRLVGIISQNDSVSLQLAKDFILLVAESLDFDNEPNFSHLEFLDQIVENGGFLFNPEWQKEQSFDISNLSELELMLETDKYDTEIYELQNPSYKWVPAKVLGSNDEFMLIDTAKTKELGYLYYLPGSKASTLDIYKKKNKGKKATIDDCVLLNAVFKPDSDDLIFKDKESDLADASVNTFKPSNFLKKLKKSSKTINPTREEQIEEFEKLCPALSTLIDNVTGCSASDKTRKLWLLNHFHHILLERPAGKEEVVVFHGDKGGEGKSTLIEFFTSLVNANIEETYDRHGLASYVASQIANYSINADIKDFCGNFNSPFLKEKLFITINEGDFKDEAQKNALIEQCKFIASPGKKSITAKFEHNRIMETYANIFICTNYQELVFDSKEKNQLDRRAMEFFANHTRMEELPYFKNAVEQGLVAPNRLTNLLYQEVENLIEWFNSRLVDYDLVAERPMDDRVESERASNQDGIHRLISMIEAREDKQSILDLAEDSDLLSQSSKSGIFDRDEAIKANRQKLDLLLERIFTSMDNNKGVLIKTSELKSIFGIKLRNRIKDVWVRSFGARFYENTWSRELSRNINYVIKLRGFEAKESKGE